MEFTPANNVVKRCIQSLVSEEKGNIDEAAVLSMQAWSEATDEFEKFIAAYFVARFQRSTSDRLRWLEISLQSASQSDDIAPKSAFYSLYSGIAMCHEQLNNPEAAKKDRELAVSLLDKIYDQGPFFHGTKANLRIGDLLTAGHVSNYDTQITMNHVYFTALVNGAGLAAELAKGDGVARVYMVEPTGKFENDPNVTDKKFPGNLTRSYRTQSPLKIVGETVDWVRQTPEQLKQWNEKLANTKGKIIN